MSGGKPYYAVSYNLHTYTADNFISLLFITQKNGSKGELISNKETGQPRVYVVASIRRCVVLLQ